MKSQTHASKVLKSQKSNFFYAMRRITLPSIAKVCITAKSSVKNIEEPKVSLMIMKIK